MAHDSNGKTCSRRVAGAFKSTSRFALKLVLVVSLVGLAGCDRADTSGHHAASNSPQKQSPPALEKPEFTLSVFRDYCKSVASRGDAEAIRALVETHGAKLKARVTWIDSDLYGGITTVEVSGPPDVLSASFAGAPVAARDCGEQCGQSVARKGTTDYWLSMGGDPKTGVIGLSCRAFDPQGG